MTLAADDMSMPMDAEMSWPFDDSEMSFPPDETMSMPMDETMSMPMDEAMSFDLTLSLPGESNVDEDACDEETHSVAEVSHSFEVDTFGDQSPVGILSDVLVRAIQEAGYSLCPASGRKLGGRKLEESIVLGVKVLSITTDDDVSCLTSGSDCEVVTADFGVIHNKDGSSDEEATKEFLENLEAQLSDGVRLRADTDSESIPANPIEKAMVDKSMSSPMVAMASVLSIAGVAGVLVLVQRKLAKKKRGDEKSADGSMSTAQNTTQDSSSLA